jgi:ABC-type transport system involved in multi-copper enzyme maturation permease subunit
MTVLPVIGRELRAAARTPFSYYLRVLGVIALLLTLCFEGARENLGSGNGGKLFAYFHASLFVAIWFLVPLLAADSISRERREGTLPLLFLTPLEPRGIVYGKGFVHGLRAFTLLLAVLPVLTICFLIGGLAWTDVVLSLLVNFSAVCLALAAGLAASALTTIWARALGLAMALAFMFLMIFLFALPYFVVGALAACSCPVPDWLSVQEAGPEELLAFAVNIDGFWQGLQGQLGIGPGPLVAANIGVAVFALLCALLACSLAAWMVSRTWRDRPLSARALRVRERLFKPIFFQPMLHRWLRWELRHNPIGWLEQRSWSGRLVIWSWFAIVACAYSSFFANMSLYSKGFETMQNLLGTLLALSIAVSAAGSFRRERESGVLELLLVAPLRESQIVLGRVRGLWWQFIPASALLCGVWLYCATFMGTASQLLSVLLFLVTFGTLPVIGLYFSLTRGTFIAALLWTLVAVFILPAALVQTTSLLLEAWGMLDAADWPLGVVRLASALFQIMLALFLGWRLRENLKHRKFASERAGF